MAKNGSLWTVLILINRVTALQRSPLVGLVGVMETFQGGLNDRSCTSTLRIIILDLSRVIRTDQVSLSWHLKAAFQDFAEPSLPAYGHTSRTSCHDQHLRHPLTAAVAT